MIELSEQTQERLTEIAKRNNITEQQMLDYLINNRWLISSHQRNAMRKLDAWKKYQHNINYDPNDIAKIFFSGYNAGWWDFQTRHEDKEIPIIIEYED